MPYKSNFKKVSEFHKAFKVDEQDLSYKDTLALREKLIKEEVDETVVEFNEIRFNLDNEEKPNHEKLLKELVDILYVVYGTAVSLGLDIDDAFDEVHKSNMLKLDDDGNPIFREDGKILKGPNYKAPDLKKIVKE